jgi:hypothetical protein
LCAVPRPIEQLRAICRSPRPTFKLQFEELRIDNLLAGKLILPFEGRLPAIVLSSLQSACRNHSGEAEHDSGFALKLLGFIPDPVFTFIPESCSR